MTTHTTILSLPVLNVLNADELRLPGGSLAPTRGPIRSVGDLVGSARQRGLTQPWLTDATVHAALHHRSMTPTTWRAGALW